MRGGDASKQYSFDGIKDNAFTESETTLNNGESNHSFKYSKEYMLSLYDKSLEQPVNIQQNEFVFVSQGQSPVSLLENENKVYVYPCFDSNLY
jgi:hypothetical protein